MVRLNNVIGETKSIMLSDMEKGSFLEAIFTLAVQLL